MEREKRWRWLHWYCPDPKSLIAMAPEELATVLLDHMNWRHSQGERNEFNRINFAQSDVVVGGYDPKYYDNIRRVVMAAWVWMEHEGFIAPMWDQKRDWVCVTKKGGTVKVGDNPRSRDTSFPPWDLIHSNIATSVKPIFQSCSHSGNYDPAVSEAFRRVEIAVREKSKLQDIDTPNKLMTEAFQPDRGPLSDASLKPAERLGQMLLFQGAMLYFRNASTHRLAVDDPQVAAEIVVFASHLMRIVDASTP